jgi:hypothetical protein
MVAVVNAMDALAERFVEDAPKKRFEEKKKLLECEFYLFLLSWLCSSDVSKPIVADSEQPNRRLEALSYKLVPLIRKIQLQRVKLIMSL